MWICRSWAVCALLLGVVGSAIGQAVTLRIREVPGAVYHQTFRLQMSFDFGELPAELAAFLDDAELGESAITMHMYTRTRVVSVENGLTTLRQSIHMVTHGFPNLGDEPDAPPETAEMITEMAVNPLGRAVRSRVLSSQGLEAMGLDDAKEMMAGDYQSVLYFPQHPVKPGDSWTVQDAEGVKHRILFFDWEEWRSKRVVRLEMTPLLPDFPGAEITGPMVALIDPATGRLLHMSASADMEFGGMKTSFRMSMDMEAPR